jgi:two-component system, OmpR family, phosphate regulon sensor histidine kinase PhoR
MGRKKHFEILVVPVSEDLTILEKPCHRWVGCLAVFRDITPMKNTEKMRKDFVANVSHELRTPLSVLKGYTETLLDGALQEPDVAQQFVETMARHADRLSQLVEDLLDLSRLESEESPLVLEALALGSLLSKVVSMSRDSATLKHITLEYEASFETANNPLWVLAHSASLEQVLVNLIDNAIKYTPEQGKVQVLVSVQADLVQLAIKDNGIGIPAKHIPRLFERFYRVDKARSREMGGTGLGLSIVKHIVQAHGGDIWVASEPGKGSTFYFTLRKALTVSQLNLPE